MLVWRALQQPSWIARIVFLVGALSVASALMPSIGARAHLLVEMVPDAFPAAAATGTAAIGLILVALSRALRRGKFRAWLLATVLTGTAAALHVLKGLDVEEASLCLALTVLLATARKNFTARPDPRSARRVWVVLTLGTVVATLVGVAWLTFVDRGQAAGTTFGDRLVQAFLGLVGIPGPVHYTTEDQFGDAAVALAVLGAAVLLFSLMVAMQPKGGPHPLSADERSRVHALLAKWGWMDSLGYFTLRDDRAVIFAPDGNAALTYRVIGGVSLAGGDPIGNPSSWPGAVTAWLEEAKSYGWVPAALGPSERGATAFHRAGLDVLELGDEAVVHASDFTLNGRQMRGVRQAVSRCERAGITVTARRLRDLTPEDLDEARRYVDEWRDGPVERGFSMALGRFGAPEDSDGVLVLARGQDGVPVGLLHFVPWGADGLSLDLMRRARDGENGIVETMVAGLMGTADDLGVVRVSLNFAVFRSVFARGEKLGAGPVLRLWRGILLWASRFWQIESLYRANAKYQPEWVARYLVYRSPSDLPKVATAALRAEAFLVMPQWCSRLMPSGRREDYREDDRDGVSAAQLHRDAGQVTFGEPLCPADGDAQREQVQASLGEESGGEARRADRR